jgi:serine/threonine protein kinase
MSPVSQSNQGSSEGFPDADQRQRPVAAQPTVLLSEAPSGLPPEQPANSASSYLSSLNASLSAAALAALSQRYDVLSEAGHGSMGNVYKARDRETGETVALKLLKPEIASDQAMMDRFKNELLFARKITHKSICRVHEFNRIGGVAYTSMEFVEGESLRSVLNRFGGLPPRKVIDLAQQMCSGLKEAHAQGIVHRDLKPENVMIDAQGNVKIMDFGIARSMDVATRLTGSMVGTPAYMAPEQVASKPVDYRTDIYSLGLILYEMFTGVPAFQADNAVAVALKQMQESPRPPHEIEPNMPAAMERVVLKCLEKDPARRFQSCAELDASIKLPGAPAPQITRAAPPVIDAGVSVKRYAQTPEPLAPFADVATPRSRSVVGLIFSWLLLLAALGGAGYAGWRWLVPVVWPDAFSFPQAPAAPKIPDFALDASSSISTSTDAASQSTAPATANAPEAPAASATALSKSAANSSDDAAQAAPATPVAAKNAPESVKPSQAPPKKPASPDAASAEDATAAAEAALSGMIWVGRYERRDRADVAAKEIEDLGLPSAVVPRKGAFGNQFFVVLTGPFAGKKLIDTTTLLQADGFANARPVQNMEGNSTSKQNSNQQQTRHSDQ